jgi:hypothetical protein
MKIFHAARPVFMAQTRFVVRHCGSINYLYRKVGSLFCNADFICHLHVSISFYPAKDLDVMQLVPEDSQLKSLHIPYRLQVQRLATTPILRTQSGPDDGGQTDMLHGDAYGYERYAVGAHQLQDKQLGICGR